MRFKIYATLMTFARALASELSWHQLQYMCKIHCSYLLMKLLKEMKKRKENEQIKDRYRPQDLEQESWSLESSWRRERGPVLAARKFKKLMWFTRNHSTIIFIKEVIAELNKTAQGRLTDTNNDVGEPGYLRLQDNKHRQHKDLACKTE